MNVLPIFIIWILIAVISSSKKSKSKTRQGQKSETVEKKTATVTQMTLPLETPASGSRTSGTTKGKNTRGKTSGGKNATASTRNTTQKNDIVARAKSNAAKLKEDETLKEIEASHGHSEAEHVKEVAHSRNCQTLKHNEGAVLVEESYLGTTEDLIVKGYSGDMHFDRDFIGEAMDMLNAISETPSES